MKKSINLAAFLCSIILTSNAYANLTCDNNSMLNISAPGEYVRDHVSFDSELTVPVIDDVKGTAHFITSGDFDKPVILVEGFDFGGIFGCEEIIAQIENKRPGLLSKIQAGERDLVVLNFSDSTRLLQNNAAALVRLLDTINGNLSGVNSKFVKQGNHPNAVIGLSMGGVISRFALASMEYDKNEHNTSLFISYDSPQKYANFPLSAMLLANQMHFIQEAMYSDSSEMNHLISSTYQSPAGKQLLVTRPTLSFADEHTAFVKFDQKDYREEFHFTLTHYNTYPDGDYPKFSRNIAISNGGSRGENSKHTFSNDTILGKVTVKNFAATLPSLALKAASLEDKTQAVLCEEKDSRNKTGEEYVERKSKVINNYQTWLLAIDKTIGEPCLLSGTYMFGNISNTGLFQINPYEIPNSPTAKNIRFDEAPGSYVDGNTDLLGAISNNSLFDLSLEPFSFIPTTSSIDYRPRDINGVLEAKAFDLFVDFSQIENLAEYTPFDAVYLPSSGNNERHMEISDEKANQLIQEILAFHVISDSDMDGDGLSNQFEVTTVGSDIAKSDTDDDGVPDGYERKYGMNPIGFTAAEKTDDRYGDIDFDGVSNYHEYCGSILGSDMDCVGAYSSDPTDTNSTPSNRRDILVATLAVITINLL